MENDFGGAIVKYRLMDFLACPICKHFPLDLHVFEEARSEVRQIARCEEYCGYDRRPVRELRALKCYACTKLEIVEGLLRCPSCNRWYPIEEGIPRMLPDELRESDEVEFLKRHAENIPRDVLERGRPFNLSGLRVQR